MYMPTNFGTDEDIPSEAYYVAAVALRNIGNPALEAVLARIEESDNQDERDLAAWIVREIDGPEQAEFRLRRWAERRPHGADRFRSAAAFVANYQPILAHPARAKAMRLERDGK
jgi:hypothetical protein